MIRLFVVEGMITSDSIQDYVKCPHCKKAVLKQVYCSKCGRPLSTKPNAAKDQSERKTADHLNLPEETEPLTESPLEQLNQLKDSAKNLENERISNLKEEPLVLNSQIEDAVVTIPESVDDGNAESEETTNGFLIEKTPVAEEYPFTPDPSLKELVQKIVKQVMYESVLLNHFENGEVPEEAFLKLFEGVATEVHKLASRKAEIIEDVELATKECKSVKMSALQALNLLDIRRSIDDVTDEEYNIKSAFYKWDINHSDEVITEGEHKVIYLKELGRLINSEEIDELRKITMNCEETLSKTKLSNGARDKVKNTLLESRSILGLPEDL